MQIKSMPANERPQEKLLYYGPEMLSDTELLALMIRSGNKDVSAIQLAEEVLSYAASELGGLDKACVNELRSVKGIGTSKACTIVAGIELARRLRDAGRNDERPKVNNISEAAELLLDDFQSEKREHLVELILNNRKEVEAKVTVSIGVLSQAVVGPREVFAPAIRRGAAGIIIAHNHPSGDPRPSQDDIDTTRRLVEVSKVVGIELLDHIILGRNSYVSLREEGLM